MSKKLLEIDGKFNEILVEYFESQMKILYKRLIKLFMEKLNTNLKQMKFKEAAELTKREIFEIFTLEGKGRK